MAREVNFLILTIKAEEFQAVLGQFERWESVPVHRGRWINRATFDTPSGTRTVAVVAASEQGTGEAQSLTIDLLEDLAPEWIVVAGIAGARPDSGYSLGDVVVSTHIHDLTVHDVASGKPSSFSTKGGPLHEAVKGFVANLPAESAKFSGWEAPGAVGQLPPSIGLDALKLYGPADWQEIVRRSLSANFPGGVGRPPRFVTGEIASSDVLVKDPAFLISILGGAKHVAAVEMESAGVYRAVRDRASNRKLIAIRGLSDVVGLKRDDVWTKYACLTVASFVRRFVELCPAQESHVVKTAAPVHPLPAPAVARGELTSLRQKASKITKAHRGVTKVSRTDLETLIADARATAKSSTISLGGDLSWLPRDLPTLRALRVKRPGVTTIVYYDRRGVDSDALAVFSEIASLGIELRPYPVRVSRIKALLVDWGFDDQKAFVFRRVGSRSFSGEKPLEFYWQELRERDWVAIEALNSLVFALDLARVPTFVVGVSGGNNVGKSTLVSYLKDNLNAFGFRDVEVVADVFDHSASTTPEQNFFLLWRQKDREGEQSRAQIRILDRTLIDHLCYLKIRGGDALWSRLDAEIGNQLSRYDMLLHVRRKDGDYSDETHFLKPSQRKEFQALLDTFFRNHLVQPIAVEIDSTNLDPSLRQAAASIADQIRRRLLAR